MTTFKDLIIISLVLKCASFSLATLKIPNRLIRHALVYLVLHLRLFKCRHLFFSFLLLLISLITMFWNLFILVHPLIPAPIASILILNILVNLWQNTNVWECILFLHCHSIHMLLSMSVDELLSFIFDAYMINIIRVQNLIIKFTISCRFTSYDL